MTICEEMRDELLKDIERPEDFQARDLKMSPSRSNRTFGGRVLSISRVLSIKRLNLTQS